MSLPIQYTNEGSRRLRRRRVPTPGAKLIIQTKASIQLVADIHIDESPA
jgi:hypothetical protein